MAEAHEIRVHGVAGTSPESMLQLAAVRVTDAPGSAAEAPEQITLWRPPTPDPRLRAWSWASLTSGRWYQAFYLLLLPFMIANLAGWMLAGAAPTDAGRTPGGPAEHRTARLRVAALLVRVVGMLVTVVFVVSVQIVVADLVAWQWLYRDAGGPLWIVGLGPVVAAAVLFGLVVLARIRPKPEELAVPPGTPWWERLWRWWGALAEQWHRPRDPVGIGHLARAQWVLWHSSAINVALRRLHLTVGLGTVALLAALPVGGTAVPGLRLTAIVLACAALAGALALLAWIGLRRGLEVGAGPDDGDRALAPAFWLVRWVAVVPATAALVLAALLPLWWAPTVVRDWGSLPYLRGSAVWVTVAVIVLLVLLTAVNRGGRRAANPAAVLLLAASIGAELGAGLISRAGGLVGGIGGFVPEIDQFVGWLAVAVTTSLAVLLVVGVTRWLLARRRLPVLTRSGSWVTSVVGGVGLLLVVLVVVAVRAGVPVAALPGWFALVVVLGLVVPVLAVVLATLARKPLALVAAVLGTALVAAVVVWAVTTGRSLRVAGIDVPPPTFAEFCLAVAVVLPTAAIVGRIYGGLTDRGVRRGVGVLWDVGTFWPRWFHPLAPPTYSDRAVPRLDERITTELTGPREALLLAPHSQGAVIANAAILLHEGPLDGLALLSYGSPWQRLYAEFFPTQVHPAATAEIAARLGGRPGRGRWVNLHRVTDPVGGAIPDGPEDHELPDPCHRGHSDYWAEPEYAAAVTRLRARLRL